MKRYNETAWQDKHLYVGIDVHRKRWHVTILNDEGLKLYSHSILGEAEALLVLLDHYKSSACIHTVYEAGFSGFWLYDVLEAQGYDAQITPPHKIPQAQGNRVKTDRVDSEKLASFLRSGHLDGIYVPSLEERAHRDVARTRRRMIQDRVRVQNQIKSKLRLLGLELPEENTGKWSKSFERNLRAIRLSNSYLQSGFDALLDQYDFMCEQIAHHTQLLKGLSQDETYQDRVEILCTIPGVGWLSAIEILLEVQDVSRFQTGDQLAAYIGLTPSQASTGDRIRMGHITKQGKPTVRMLLVQAAWRLIGKDGALKQVYERIKRQAGSKRAIVAVARRLLLRMRRLLLNQEPYVVGLVQG